MLSVCCQSQKTVNRLQTPCTSGLCQSDSLVHPFSMTSLTISFCLSLEKRIHPVPSACNWFVLSCPIVIGIQSMHQVQLLAVVLVWLVFLDDKATSQQVVRMDACPDGSDEHRHQEKQDDMS